MEFPCMVMAEWQPIIGMQPPAGGIVGTAVAGAPAPGALGVAPAPPAGAPGAAPAPGGQNMAGWLQVGRRVALDKDKKNTII